MDAGEDRGEGCLDFVVVLAEFDAMNNEGTEVVRRYTMRQDDVC